MTENNGLDNGRDSMGRFATGNPGKPFGSSRNKVREELKKVVMDNLNNLSEWILELPIKDRVSAIIQILPFVAPRLQSVAYSDDKITEGIKVESLSEETLHKILNIVKDEQQDIPNL